jgi:hypothetical protein
MLQEDIKFMKELGEDYKDKYSLYLKVCDELDDLVTKEDTIEID